MSDAKIARKPLQRNGKVSGIFKNQKGLDLRRLPDVVVYLIRKIVFTEKNFL